MDVDRWNEGNGAKIENKDEKEKGEAEVATEKSIHYSQQLQVNNILEIR